jgi:hypothetical protein
LTRVMGVASNQLLVGIANLCSPVELCDEDVPHPTRWKRDDMSCYFDCGTLLVERKPNDALRFLFDNHFWQKAIQEWINKLLSTCKAVDG